MMRLKTEISKPLNFEMAATADMVRIALATKPHAVCLVPERREELTTEGGLDVVGQHNTLKPFIATLNDALQIRVSLFIAADPAQIEMAAKLRAPVVEIHTGAWCDAVVDGHAAKAEAEWQRIVAKRRSSPVAAGLEVHAGHGLRDYATAETAVRPSRRSCRTGYRLLHDRGGAVRRPRRDGSRGCGRRWTEAAKISVSKRMIIGIGLDLIDIRRVAKVIERHGERFLGLHFHRRRARAQAGRRAKNEKMVVATYAKRSAAKEWPVPRRWAPASGAASGGGICGRREPAQQVYADHMQLTRR